MAKTIKTFTGYQESAKGIGKSYNDVDSLEQRIENVSEALDRYKAQLFALYEKHGNRPENRRQKQLEKNVEVYQASLDKLYEE